MATTTQPDFREVQPNDAPQWWLELSELERGVVLTTMVVIAVTGVLYGLGWSFMVVADFAPNVMTEILFFAITIVVINRLNRQWSNNKRKKELILQMGSPDNGFAREAVRLLRHYGWLTDGSLRRADLRGADLRRVDLTGVDLSWADLRKASLQGVRLIEAKLRGADLRGANLASSRLPSADLRGVNMEFVDLKGVWLMGVNLRAAHLQGANLSGVSMSHSSLKDSDLRGASLEGALVVGVDFRRANLLGADFRCANLNGAKLQDVSLLGDNEALDDAEFDEDTILPHGLYWSSDVDIMEFVRS